MKKISTKIHLLPLLVVLMMVVSCKKEEGPGGTSTIRGKVIVHKFDPAFLFKEATYPAANEKVYIIYGEDGTTYDDDFDTSYDGTYEFKHLQEGTYKLFVYSKDSTGASSPSGPTNTEDIPVIMTVKIGSNGETIDASDIIILDN